MLKPGTFGIKVAVELESAFVRLLPIQSVTAVDPFYLLRLHRVNHCQLLLSYPEYLSAPNSPSLCVGFEDAVPYKNTGFRFNGIIHVLDAQGHVAGLGVDAGDRGVTYRGR